MRLKLKIIPRGASSLDPTDTDPASGSELPFYIIGSDQSLSSTATQVTKVDFMPGERLDLVIDFKDVSFGDRVIVENVLGDAPFGGDLPEPYNVDGYSPDLFPDRRTDRVMAFDVEREKDLSVDDTYIVAGYSFKGGGVNVSNDVNRTRKLALFEGMDSIGRLQPLLGTAELVWDVTKPTKTDGSPAKVEGTMPWFAPITENPNVGDTEIWEIYNATGDAHPVHVHLVHFEVMNREGFYTRIDEVDGPVVEPVEQPVAQHDGTVGVGFRLENINLDDNVRGPDPTEGTRRDMVMALPNEVTRIKMTFTKPGRYVWHCHILSHEDHEMMRPFHVGPGPY